MPDQFTGPAPVPRDSCGRNLSHFSGPHPLDGLHPEHYARRFPALSPRMTTLLVDGDTEGIYAFSGWRVRKSKDGSPSVQVSKSDHGHSITSALATGAARAGWRWFDFRDAMLETPSTGGRHARDIQHRSGYDRAVDYLQRVWAAARELVEFTCISDRQDAHADLIALRDKISTCSWRGTKGSTNLKVLMAHWKVAWRAGGRKHTLSCREAAEIAGCTEHTALRAARRLRRWLRQLDSGTGEHGSTWCLLDGSQQRRTPMGRRAPGGEQSNVSPVRKTLVKGIIDASVVADLMSLDAFAHRGLGMSSVKILAALRVRDGQTVQELISNAMVSQATAYRHLKRLAQHQLVVHVGEVWQLTKTAQEALETLSEPWEGWGAIAAEEGTQGTAERRRARHQAQRQAWYEITLPRLRQRRMPDVQPIRGDEVQPQWMWNGQVIDPRTGEVIPDLVLADDGRLLLIDEEPDYDELVRRNRQALAAA